MSFIIRVQSRFCTRLDNSLYCESLMIDHITAFARRAEQLVFVLALRLVGALSTHS